MDLHMDTNYGTLYNCLESMKQFNKLPKKIIFSSTISVYGESYQRSIYDENSILKPSSPYAVSKKEAEDYLISNFSNVSWILRFAPVYSESFTLNIDRRTIIKDFYYKVGDGKNILSLCNVENIKHVLLGILDESIPPGIYNLADQITYDYNDLLKYQIAKRVISIPRFLFFIIYIIGRIIKSDFLIENSIKLISNNVYPTEKISAYTKLPYILKSKL